MRTHLRAKSDAKVVMRAYGVGWLGMRESGSKREKEPSGRRDILVQEAFVFQSFPGDSENCDGAPHPLP